MINPAKTGLTVYVKINKNNEIRFVFYLITELVELSRSDKRMLLESGKKNCCKRNIQGSDRSFGLKSCRFGDHAPNDIEGQKS